MNREKFKINGCDIFLSLLEKYKTESWVITGSEIESKKKSIWKNRWSNWDIKNIKHVDGLKSGISISEDKCLYIMMDYENYIISRLSTLKELKELFEVYDSKKIKIYDGEGHFFMKLSEPEILFIQEFIDEFNREIDREISLIKTTEEENKRNEKKRVELLVKSQNEILLELDKDSNGVVDIIEGNDFNLLLKKYQDRIVEVDRNYVQQFVKVSSYLKTKKGNIQSLFNSIKDTPNQEVLNEYVEILKDEIHTHNLILFNSLNMIVSLVEDDMITFYEIYEMFDGLNMFDSKHEKDVSQRLKNIGDRLESLMYEIRDMSNQISDSIGELSYVTEESNRQLSERLKEIDSSVQTNNLLTVIQTHQMYKMNRNTKSLRG